MIWYYECFFMWFVSDFPFSNFFHSLCMHGIICSNDCFSYVLSTIFSLCNSFNNLCIYGMEEFLYLSVRAIFTLNCSGFLIFECEVFSFLWNMVCSFSCLVVCSAKCSHKVILLSYNDCRLSFWRPWSYSSYSWFKITFIADFWTLSRLLESSYVKELCQTTPDCSKILQQLCYLICS